MRNLRFHRDFRRYSGGHGKIWDYFRHADAHPGWQPTIYFTPESVDVDNPWRQHGAVMDHAWAPEHADALFLGGVDWTAYPEDSARRPVVNLIQGVRHADPAQPQYAFLSRRAIRICVGDPVADAIRATGQVNGPVLTIDAGMQLPTLSSSAAGPRSEIFVGALKQQQLGHDVAQALRASGYPVRLFDTWMPRATFLDALARARVAVLLPRAAEGFFLPPLEAMALDCAVVVPDCIGNRAYLAPESNALVPPMTVAALCEAVERLQDPILHARLVAAGRETIARFGMERERAAFHDVLNDIEHLWRA